jgi:hypothetical protein
LQAPQPDNDLPQLAPGKNIDYVASGGHGFHELDDSLFEMDLAADVECVAATVFVFVPPRRLCGGATAQNSPRMSAWCPFV